jgi:hypothetical protein
MTANRLLSRIFLARCAALLLALAGAGALAQTDPPARVASLSQIEGSVVLAPAGDTEWTDAVLNRPVTRGDRLWTDQGGRAEVHLGSAVLHVDGETFLDFTALDDRALQASLNEGSLNARVRQLDAGENFEIDTPHLAFRAAQPGDYRIDVDPANGTTQVTVRSGSAIVYGASGRSQQLVAGQQLAFAGRDLERVAAQAPRDDGFDRWAADRNRREDASVAARYVPRDVVGYQQLDPYGTWAEDPSYGAIWFPQITIADWAPYRYGHWEWIRPWGWTWVDDAPWGFAPFHYGRWAMIGRRWAWVPGHIGPRPIYSPALVAFIGGTGDRASWSLSIGSSPGIAWYPLAPGEAWRPFYRASPTYVRNANRYTDWRGGTSGSVPIHQRGAEAVTAVRVDDFRQGRPVHSHWTPVKPSDIARAPVGVQPVLPQPQRPLASSRAGPPASLPRVAPPAPAIVGRPQGPAPQAQFPGQAHPRPSAQGQPHVAPPATERRESGDRSTRPSPPFTREEGRGERARGRDEPPRPFIQSPPGPVERPQVRTDEQRRQTQSPTDEQRRAQARQLQLQQLERARRDQQAADQRVQREQQLPALRQQEAQRRAEQAQLQREHALRQQQAVQQRQQQDRQQAVQERLAQQQQARAQREQAARQQQDLQQQRALQQQQQAQRQMAAPAAPPAAARAEPRERRQPQPREGRDERRVPPGEEEGRGRGQGHGRGG